MTAPTLLVPVLALTALLTGCGNLNAGSLIRSPDDSPKKVPCPGTHAGFYVCLSDTSRFASGAVENAVAKALVSLDDVVNRSDFQAKILAAFPTGQEIVNTLTSTDYIVQVTGFCNAMDEALATAVIGGDTINYNECRVSEDASGEPDIPEVAGVLLHEIMHNLGYNHPDSDPARTSVPYYLGDLATAELGGEGHAASTGRALVDKGGG